MRAEQQAEVQLEADHDGDREEEPAPDVNGLLAVDGEDRREQESATRIATAVSGSSTSNQVVKPRYRGRAGGQ